MRMVGGQAQQSDRLQRHLQALGDVDTFFVAIDPKLPAWLEPVTAVRGVRTAVRELFYLADLLRAVPQADVVHVFSASYYAFMLHTIPALVLARWFGKPAILNYRSGEAEDHLANWRLTALPFIRRFATAVVAPSGYLVDVFARFGVRAQAIGNFIELERFRFRRRASIAPKVLANRLLEPLYNYPCLFRAFQRVQAVYPDATLTIASEGPDRASIEADARSLGLQHVAFLGRVSPVRMAELYDEADIYLTTPNVDCMPGSLLECAASGLPIVATNAGGIPYIVEDARSALLAPVNDHVRLAEHMLRLLKEPGLGARLADAARADVERHYVADVVVGAWRDLYYRLRGASTAR
jgi:glycosyltransferase involved in cell wall biosynthesis